MNSQTIQGGFGNSQNKQGKVDIICEMIYSKIDLCFNI